MDAISVWRRSGAVATLVLLSAMAGVLVSGRHGETQLAGEHAIEDDRLISVQPAPQMEGQVCEWVPASAPSSLMTSLQRAQTRRGTVASEAARTAAAKRPPVRIIHDTYPAFSSVAVDPVRNEVVMTDENLFSILVYDRLENTPPGAAMSEPKRIIKGKKTEIELQCGLYVDPANGDIYAVNNDTVDKVVVFSRAARGDVAPDRTIETPHTIYGIAVDEKNQELMLTVQDDAAVVTFRKAAPTKDSPLRTLQGARTLLADPHGIAIDAVNDVVFVSNWGTVNVHQPPASGPVVGGYGRGAGRINWPVGRNYVVPGSGKFMPPSITVHARTASGDTPPLRVIQGPQTGLNWPTALALDPERGELYVANDPTDSILIFKSDASGDAAPIRVLRGAKTSLKNPTGVYLDLKNDEFWVANFGNHTATVYKRGTSGDTPPLRTIRSGPAGAPAPMMGNPAGLAYDTKREELLVAN